MKKVYFVFILSFAFMMAGCQKNNMVTDVSIHPSTENGFVGDPMPYYDGGKINIFFLDDQRLGTQGYHPWSRFTTTDFSEFDFKGVVIPYGDNIKDQDIALGTGSVIKDKEGVYHAFYTGRNDTYSPKEAIMHATSSDLQSWDKHKADSFYAENEYSSDDFRDPYVFYNENEKKYWMLVTTRKNNMGVIALYKSSDLIKWKDEKVLFTNDMGSDSNLESPALFEWNGYWYLTFSDQWPDRLVHYRIAKSPDGPFEKPGIDYFDGSGFYAGRPVEAAGNVYLLGWNGTKDGHQDENSYNWGGNLIIHQLKQKDDGLLNISAVQSVIKKMNRNRKVSVQHSSETIKKAGKTLCFSGENYEIASFPKINGSTKISGKIKINDKTDIFGFAFNVGNNKYGTLNFVFNKQKDYIGFFNKSTEQLSSEEAQSKVNYNFREGDEIEFTILFDNTVATLYVNDEVALTARMYSANQKEWGFFGDGSNITLQDIKVYKY